MAKLIRFSLACYIGVFLLTLSSARHNPDLTLQDILLFPLMPVGAVWVLWAVGVIGEDAAEVVRYGTERVIVALARAPELPQPERVRQIHVHDHFGDHLIDYNPEPDYRRLVIGFVIRGGQIGGYTYRQMQNRMLAGAERVDFELWRRITDESYVFVKSNHGTALRYPLMETVRKLAEGLPLANEKMRYHPDEVTIESG